MKESKQNRLIQGIEGGFFCDSGLSCSRNGIQHTKKEGKNALRYLAWDSKKEKALWRKEGANKGRRAFIESV